MSQPIFIIGAPRSGTSMVAGLLAHMGVWAGETVGASPDNPKGFFEHTALREGINKPLLAYSLADPLGVRSLPDWEDCAFLPNLRAQALKLIGDDGYESGPWLFKDCKSVLLFPSWHKAFPEAKWIVVRRKPEDVIRSCLNTRFMHQHSMDPRFWGEWYNAYLAKLNDIAAVADCREIWPQKLMEGDEGELREIAAWLGLDYHIPEGFIEKSAWKGTKKGEEPLLTSVYHNTRKSKLYDQVKANLGRGLPELEPESPHRQPIAIVAGGPSLKSRLGMLKRLKRSGGHIMALNGVHDFLLKHGIKPSSTVLMDARPDNVDFVTKPQKGIVYYLASQCHPDVFDKLAGHDVRMWHVGASGAEQVLNDIGHDGTLIMGGCTVGMRAIPMSIFLGHREVHLVGMDSCLTGKQHHAYSQERNDGDKLKTIRCGGKEFTCAIWMARQAQDFQMLCQLTGDKLLISAGNPNKKFKDAALDTGRILAIIHGRGLLAEMAKEARRLHDEERTAA